MSDGDERDPFVEEPPISPRIWAEVHMERLRAHAKHAASSIENDPVTSPRRLSVLMEEVGEVAREMVEFYRDAANDPEGSADAQPSPNLRAELIQVAAMAGAWADALTEGAP